MRALAFEDRSSPIGNANTTYDLGLSPSSELWMPTTIPETGQIVRVRQRQYLVGDVVQLPRAGEATLLRLSCLDDDAQGQPLEVLWENEIDAEPITGSNWQDLTTRGFDPPRL